MSRMKINFLTQMGRQVSEDPDLDTLLSTLSPEEMEELQEDMMKAPEVNPEAGQSRPDQPSTSNNINNTARDAKVDSRKEGDLRGKLRQREQSQEQSDTKKESQKQEYLRKMGLTQEGNEDRRSSLRRQPSERIERDVKSDERNNKGPEGLKEERSRLSGRYRTQESRESEANEKESFSDSKLRRDRESTGSKAKDMISKLQDQRDDKEKDQREDFRRRDESKTKDIISKLREKSEKDAGKERERKSENFRTQGLVSKMLEKQNKAVESKESKTDERKTKVEEKKVEEKKKMDVKLERQTSVKGEVKVKHVKAEKESEDLVNHSDHVKEKDKSEKTEEKKEDLRGMVKTDVTKTDKADEKTGNCVAKDSQTKEEENDDEDSSMFDELMEQVRSNDPSLTELNVNNSEVIKIKTLIEFAEALRNNTHIKTFALANCRADDHVAYAIAGMLRNNKTITSLNVDSNHLTGKGILSLIQALQYNSTLTELRFQNQRHICGGKTEMEMTKILKDNTTLLKLGYHFELAGPRMTTTNILSRNMDRQRQKRLQEQKQAQANGDKKETLDVPKTGGGGSLRNSPKASPKPSPIPSPMPSPKLTPKRRTGGPTPPPPPPPPGGTPPPPPPPMFDIDSLKNTLTPVSQRKLDGKGPGGSKNSRDQLLASIRKSNINQLKKVPVPRWLQ